MKTHKSKDYKLSAVEYYLSGDNTQEKMYVIYSNAPQEV